VKLGRFVPGASAALLVAGGVLASPLGVAWAQQPPGATAQQAITAALAKYPGGTLLEVDREGGRVGPTFHEVEVRAADGRVWKVLVDPAGAVVAETLDDDHAPAARAQPPAGAAPPPSPAVTLEQAVAAALAKHPGGTVLDADLEGRRGGPTLYGVEVRATDARVWKLVVDGSGGVVGEMLDKPAPTAPVPLPGGLTFQQASAAALARHPGGTVVEVDLERRRTAAGAQEGVYQVEVRAADGRVWEVLVGASGVIGEKLDD
jgi:uncharacterized membrane protein YkoI